MEWIPFGHAKEEDVPCKFCGGRDGDGHLFLGVHVSPSSACSGTS